MNNGKLTLPRLKNSYRSALFSPYFKHIGKYYEDTADLLAHLLIYDRNKSHTRGGWVPPPMYELPDCEETKADA